MSNSNKHTPGPLRVDGGEAMFLLADKIPYAVIRDTSSKIVALIMTRMV